MSIILRNYKDKVKISSILEEQLLFSIESESCNILEGIWINFNNIEVDIELILKYNIDNNNSNIFYNKIIKKDSNRLLLIPGNIPIGNKLCCFIKLLEEEKYSKEIQYSYFIEGMGLGHLWEYILTEANTGYPIQGANITVCLDTAGKSVVTKGITDSSGKISCYLDPGNYFIFRSKSGYIFTDPDIENVS